MIITVVVIGGIVVAMALFAAAWVAILEKRRPKVSRTGHAWGGIGAYRSSSRYRKRAYSSTHSRSLPIERESYIYTLSPRAREHFGHNRKGRNHAIKAS